MMATSRPRLSAVLLAAGVGSRLGCPKALLRMPDGTPLIAEQSRRMAAVEPLESIVVLGARAGSAVPLVPHGVRTVICEDWARGLSASLRAGLSAAAAGAPSAVLVMLADLVDVPATAHARLAGAVVNGTARPPAEALARCAWNGHPGHPVVFGAGLLEAVMASASGDTGARRYLREHAAQTVAIECADLLAPGMSGGFDIDTREAAEQRGMRIPAPEKGVEAHG